MATTMAGLLQASPVLPSCAATTFSRSTSVSARPIPSCFANKLRSSLTASSSSLSSGSSSFRGRICLILTGEVRETRRSGVQASLLGVGAPEALVIGVVALLVFGPKGLAEVARTLGKSLRAFQPTIKELQQVSREFKATLEQEIGLDELRNPTNDYPPMSSQARPNSVSSSTPTSMPSTLSATEAPPAAPPAAPQTEDGSSQPKPYTTEDYLRITEDQANALSLVTEEQRKASEAAAWGGSPPVKPAEEAPSASETPAVEAPSAPETPAESFFSGTSQKGSTPTAPIDNSSGNGSSKV